MNKNKKVLVLSTIGILIMIGCIAGVTYAWFASDINGDGAEFNVITAKIGPLTYTGTEITTEGILPGWISEDATLKVEGTITGSETVNYHCNIENTGEVTDVEYRISVDGEESSENATWRTIDETAIVSGVISSSNSEDEYKLAVRFKETGLDQNDQQGKTLGVNVTCEVGISNNDAALAYTCVGCETVPTTFPKRTDGYYVTGVDCTNGTEAKWNPITWMIEFQAMNVPSVCTIHLEQGGFLYSRILSDNPNVSKRSGFGAIYTTSNNGDTIYEAEGENGNTTYYFAGNVTNNYVKFTNADGSEMWWRIIRINEDNSVRLLYYGTDKEGTGMFPSTSLAFNTNYYNSAYVGYEYALGSQHGLGTNSDIKTYLESWYTSNLASFDEYISRTAIYCNDRTVGSGTWSATGDSFEYIGWIRLYMAKAPTFACSETADKFTGSEVTGNGKLGEKPIGLITADEVSYAGGLWGTNNTNYYISEKTTGITAWWTMTPSIWGSGAYEFYVGGVLNGATGRLGAYDVNNTFGVRPVISLKGCVEVAAGKGTTDEPYEVSISDACKLTEN